jgi:hypothetical protein
MVATSLFLPCTAVFGVDRQREASTTQLGPIALARHVTQVVSDFRARARQRIAAETLARPLGPRNAVARGVAVRDAAGRGDFADAEIGELDTGEDARVEHVGVAARVGPVRDGGVGGTGGARRGCGGGGSCGCGGGVPCCQGDRDCCDSAGRASWARARAWCGIYGGGRGAGARGRAWA